MKKGNIVTSPIEHHSISKACSRLEPFGISSKLLKIDSKGIVNIDSLKESISDDTLLVSVMTANNEIGTVQDIENLSAIAHKNGVRFHTDAVQALGHIPIDMSRTSVDYLSASAHKFGGPKGIGFLFVREGADIPPLLVGGSQESGLRAGTENIASIVGMAKALSLSIEKMPHLISMMQVLENRLLSQLYDNNIDFILNTPKSHIPGCLSLSFADYNGIVIQNRLDLKGISVSVGSACNGYSDEISDVVKALSIPEKYSSGTIRVSLGLDNDLDDIDRLSQELINIVSH
jgi:cysteine desulfurase